MKRLKHFLISLSFLILLSAPFSAKIAFADTFSLSGTVKDSLGNAIIGASVIVNNVNFDSTTTDDIGYYFFPSLQAGIYNIQVTPPSGYNFSPAIAVNQTISNNTTINFVLVPTGTVTLTGKVIDRDSHSLPDQNVAIAPLGTNTFISSRTDNNGNYSFTVAPGNYVIKVSGTNTLTVSAPAYYSISKGSTLALTQSMIMNIPLPVKKVTLKVQDESGTAQENIVISTNSNNISGLPIGITNSFGAVSSYSTSAGLKTDSSGIATLWLFPTNSSSGTYTITATPSTGTPSSLSSIKFSDDVQFTLVLKTQLITLSGRVLGRAINGIDQPLANQTVAIAPSGTNNYSSSVTNSNGNYSFTVAPGNYSIKISGTNPLNTRAPAYYNMSNGSSLVLTQNMTMDIPIPAKQVNLHVKDAIGTAQSNIVISTNLNNISGLPIGTTTSYGAFSSYSSSDSLKTDSSGNATLWLFPTNPSSGTYTITATPPSDSPFFTSTLPSVRFTDDIPLTLILQSPLVTLSGRVLGRAVNGVDQPLANQTVSIAPAGTSNYISTTTGSNGNYNFTVVPGNYYIKISGTNTLNASAPASYSMSSSGILTLNQSKIMDIPIPVKQVTLHVQDDSGVAQEDILISTNSPNIPGLPLGIVTTASNFSSYSSSDSLKTDSSGNATLWLFPTNPSSGTYTITATPQNRGIYDKFSLSNITISDDQTEIIELKYISKPPEISPIPNSPVSEGSRYEVTGSFSDSDSTSWTGTVDFGDGTGKQQLLIDQANKTFKLSHIYLDNGSYKITVTIKDDKEIPGISIATEIVNNVSPTTGPFIAAPISILPGGITATNDVEFKDPGILDWHTAFWDWGDDSATESATLIESNGAGLISGTTHTYSSVGLYTITLNVVDKDKGLGSSKYQYVTVVSPTRSGLFSGHSQFKSPAGSYPQNPELTGNVQFMINIKYANGETVPTGNVQMKFPSANFTFTATSYNWLIVKGTQAILTGSGTVNGQGGYTFLASGLDGTQTGKGLIRFQIKDSQGDIIYDSQMSAPIDALPAAPVTAGMVVVHD